MKQRYQPYIFFYISTFLLFLLPLFLRAENGVTGIKGQVLSADGKPAPGVTVGLKSTRYYTVTNEKGHFEIKAPAGSYTLTVSFIGAKSLEQPVVITDAAVTGIPAIKLEETASSLGEVVVVGNQYRVADKESEYVAKMQLRNLENPQVYSVASRALLQEQAIVDYVSALRAIPGVSGALIRPGYNSWVYLRGFVASDNFRDGMYVDQGVNADPVNTERIEVIKGPSGTLFGANGVSYGGLINRVTKKPFDRRAGEIDANLGSYGYSRLTVDVNTPLNEDKTALFRVNAAGSWDNGFQDYGFKKSYTIAPSFSYKLDDRTDVLFSTEFLNMKANSPVRVSGIDVPGVTNINQLQRDYFKSYGSNKLSGTFNIRSFYTKITHRFSDDWKLDVNVNYSDYNYEIGNVFLNFKKDSLWRYYGAFSNATKSLAIQPNLTGDFKIGKLRNRLLVGLDYLHRDTRYSPLGNTVLVDGLDYTKSFVPPINAAKVLADGEAAAVTTLSKPVSYAAYVTDVISLTDRLNVLLSLRINYFDNKKGTEVLETGETSGDYDQTSLSPKFGATYEVIKDKVSLFANYQTGFNNVYGQDIFGISFKPENARQAEGGVKMELLNGRLSSTVNYYNILVENVVRQDPGNPAASIQDGTKKSRGVEAEVTGTILPGLNVVAGYAYNDIYFLKTNKGYEGKRPAGPPAHAANLWVSYSFVKGRLNGLGAGFGGNYSSSAFWNDLNTITVPGYTILNAVVFYNTKRYRFSVKADNLSDQRYWDASGNPQMPRRLMLGIAFKF
ncbi:TonB-dependent siderophore receptor [Chitinophaga sp. RCC_12]|uniref:TonB-dependent siderophore receptor n=1 Tax=Chitinophaga sp. RCC_12 TaxID=3239226 RepID=UPI0035253A6A